MGGTWLPNIATLAKQGLIVYRNDALLDFVRTVALSRLVICDSRIAEHLWTDSNGRV